MSSFADKHPELPESERERRRERALQKRAAHSLALATAIREQSWVLVRSDVVLWSGTTYWALGRPILNGEEFLHLMISESSSAGRSFRGVPWDWISELRCFDRKPSRKELIAIGATGGVHGLRA